MKKRIITIFLFILLLIPFNIVRAESFTIASNNAIMINLNNDEVIYAKDEKQLINVASMQKVMTTLVAIETLPNYDETVTIDPGMFSSLDSDLLLLGLYAGEEVTYNDLLYATMLRSAADAAYALGVKIGGTEEEYVRLMNEKARAIGMKNTVFKNTTGLDEYGQHSTVEDIAILFKYALNNPKFKEVVSTESYTTSDGVFEFDGPVHTAHGFGLSYFLGGKTGYTEGAGLCLVSYASCNNISYILVTANADYHYDYQNFFDQQTIYEYYMNNYDFKNLIEKDDLITKIKTMYDDEVEIKASRDVNMYINTNILEDLDIVYEGKEELERGVKQGDKIGKYYIKYDDLVLYEEDVLSPVTVTFKLKTVFIVVIIVLLSSLVLHLFLKSRRRKKRRR